MFDNIFDSIIIFIPLAIIIGRFVLQARNKHKKPPPKPPPQPYIGVHFEDDVDDEPVVIKAVKEEKRAFQVLESHELFGSQSLSDKPWLPAEQVLAPVFQPEKKFSGTPKEKIPLKKPAAEKKFTPPAETQTEKDFFLKLNKLSPLKQAVVMSEILGPPKALQ